MSDSTMQVINPATGENIEEIPISSREEVDAAVGRARDGFRAWQGFAGLDRAEVLHEISARLRGHADELAEIMTQEGGKPFIENRDEVTWTAACFDYYGEIARDSVGYLPAPIEPQQLALVVKEPVGTVACIVPWNYPLLLAASRSSCRSYPTGCCRFCMEPVRSVLCSFGTLVSTWSRSRGARRPGARSALPPPSVSSQRTWS